MAETKKSSTTKSAASKKTSSASKSTNGEKSKSKASSKKGSETMSEKTMEQNKGYVAQASDAARGVADSAMSAGSYVTEEVSVMGHQLVDRVKGLIQEGNVRRITVRNADRDVIMEAPLTAGVVIGSAAVAGVLAAMGGIASALASVDVEIQREKDSKKSKN